MSTKRYATCARSGAWLAALGAVSAFATTPADQSVDRLTMKLSAAERDALIAEANAAPQVSTLRQASAMERAELARTATGSEATNDTRQLKNGTSGMRELRRGDAVGLVTGTRLMSHQKVTIVDGEHLHTCSSDSHTHDAATTAKIAEARKAAIAAKNGKGGPRE
jgi:hypothetical protein